MKFLTYWQESPVVIDISKVVAIRRDDKIGKTIISFDNGSTIELPGKAFSEIEETINIVQNDGSQS